jgi:branched-chain amino acid transport system permease protein
VKTPELRSRPGSPLATAVVPLAVMALLATVPFVASAYLQDLVVRILVLAIFALSLELLVGTTGLVSLGHAAFLGIGAYATVLGAPASEPGSFVGLLALAIGAAGLYAAVTGALSLRTKGVYFIMVTLAFAQMAYFIVHDTKAGGGSDGIYLNLKPVVGPADAPWLDPGGRVAFYFVVLAAFALV